MIAQTGGSGRHYLKCSQAVVGHCPARGIFWPLAPFEEALLDCVAEIRFAELFVPSEAPLQAAEAAIGAAVLELERLNGRRKSLVGLAVDSKEAERAAYRDELRDLLTEIDVVKAQHDAAEAERARLLALRDSRAAADAVIAGLRAEMRRVEDPTDVQRRLSAALRSMIDFATFDHETQTIDVVLGGGLIAYRFQQSERQEPKRERLIRLVGRVGLRGQNIPLEAFPMPRERLDRLMGLREGS